MDISWNFKFALGPHGGGVMKVHALQQEDHRFDPGLEFAFVVLRLWLQDFRFFFFSVVSQQVRFVFHLKGWKSFVATDFVTFIYFFISVTSGPLTCWELNEGLEVINQSTRAEVIGL